MKALILIFGLILLLGCVGTGDAPSEAKEPTVVNIPVGEAAEQAMEAAEEEPAPEPEPEPEPAAVEEGPLDDIRHKELKFSTKDGWEIYGTVYYSDSDFPSTLVMLIPMLGSDRSSYDELVPLLHEDIPYADIIALDMRGHGKSTNIAEYTGFKSGDFRAMKNDLDAVVSYFSVGRPSVNRFYLVGASIGSSVALDYAEEHGEVSKLVMLSPGVEYQGFDISEDAENYLHEIYLVAGSGDSYSAESVGELYLLTPSDNKEKKIYYGTSAHGTALFDATKYSDEPVLDFIVSRLK